MIVVELLVLISVLALMAMAILWLLPEDANRSLDARADAEKARIARAQVRAESEIDRLTHEALDAMLNEAQSRQFNTSDGVEW